MKRFSRLPSFLCAGLRSVLLLGLAGPLSAGALPTVVTTAADYGAGSLLDTLSNAAANAGADTITFAPALAGQTLSLPGGETVVNAATGDLTIDASSLPGGVTISRAGRVIYEVWGNIPGNDLDSLYFDPRYPSSPDSRVMLPRMEGTHTGDNFGTVMSSHLVVPRYGDYRFSVAADASAQLFLSTDTREANLEMIAEVTAPTAPREWAEPDSPRTSVPVRLMPGQRYFIRVVHKEGTGSEHVAVGISKTTEPQNVEVIDGRYLASYDTTDGFRIFNVNASGNLTLRGLTLAGGGGFIAYRGGAIFNAGRVVAEDCTFTGNTALDTGGAIFSDSGSVLTLTRCTFSANTADSGGGVGSISAAFAAVNCTFSGNTADSGGAIYNQAAMSLIHTTVSANHATQEGGAIFNQAGTLTLANSIVAGNTADTAGLDIRNEATVTREGANLLGSAVHNLPAGTDSGPAALIAAPLLGPLGDNGGPTMTMALLPGSPAINAAVGGTITSDQRGFPIVGVADLGAFEAPNTPPVAGTDRVTRVKGRTVELLQSALLANDTDLDGPSALSITAVTSLSVNGATVRILGNYVVYEADAPAPNTDANDSFTYTVSDGTFTMSGTVNVTVSDPDRMTLNLVLDTFVGLERHFTVAGTPGRVYKLQFAGNVSGPWLDVSGAEATGSNATFGELLLLKDTAPPGGTSFYRVVEP